MKAYEVRVQSGDRVKAVTLITDSDPAKDCANLFGAERVLSIKSLYNQRVPQQETTDATDREQAGVRGRWP